MAVSPVNNPLNTMPPLPPSSSSSSGSGSPSGTGANSSASGSTATGSTSSSTAGGPALGEIDFLNLLITQLKQQDPTKPMDDTQFVSQMAQFSSLQETQQLNQNFTTFNQNLKQELDLQTLSQSSSLIGKSVTAGPDSTHLTTGLVTEIRQQNGNLQVVVQPPTGGSQSFDLSQIQQVDGAPAPGGIPAASSTGTTTSATTTTSTGPTAATSTTGA